MRYDRFCEGLKNGGYTTGKQGKCLYTLAKREETARAVSSLRLLGSIRPKPQNTSG